MTLGRATRFFAAVVLALGACDPPHRVVRPATKPTAPAPSAVAPRPPDPPKRGSLVVRHGQSLLVADGSSIWRVELPVGTGTPKRHELVGPVGAMVVNGDKLLVTVRDPGLLLHMSIASDGLKEIARTAIEGGADALAVKNAPRLAVVTSPAGKVIGVDLANMKLSWSVPVAAPRRVAVSDDGEVVVAQTIGISRFKLSDVAGPNAASVVSVSTDALDPVATRSPNGDGVAVAYGTLPEPQKPAAHVSTVGGTELENSVKLPRHVRAWRSHAGGIVAATDGEVLLLDSAFAVTGTSSHRCLDPRGVALSADAKHAYLACSDGRVASVPLQGGAPTYTALGGPTPVAVDCSKVKRGPVGHEFRDKLGNADQIHDWLRRYHCTYPELSDLIQIGTTHLGRPVLAMVIGNTPRLGHNKPTFLINGAHHGSELLSSTFALDAIDQLLETKHPAVKRWLREDVVFVVVPLVNPDGNMAYLKEKLLGRKNGRDNNGDGKRGHRDGVDLNRNYPFKWHSLGENGSSSKMQSRYYRGPSPASEPETQAMMRLAESERFVGSISFHTGTLAILAPYTIPKVKNPNPNEAWTVAEEIAKQIKGHPEGFMPVKKNLYAVDGTDQDWFRNEHGTLALLVEGAGNWLVEAHTRRKMVFWIRKSWTLLVDRYLDGAAVGGFVFDAVMRPVEADVSFAEIYRPEKESWTSRCRDGRFDRYLSRAGSYTLKVKVGEHSVEQKIEVNKRKRVLTRLVMPVVTTERAKCPTILDATLSPAKVVRVQTSK